MGRLIGIGGVALLMFIFWAGVVRADEDVVKGDEQILEDEIQEKEDLMAGFSISCVSCRTSDDWDVDFSAEQENLRLNSERDVPMYKNNEIVSIWGLCGESGVSADDCYVEDKYTDEMVLRVSYGVFGITFEKKPYLQVVKGQSLTAAIQSFDDEEDMFEALITIKYDCQPADDDVNQVRATFHLDKDTEIDIMWLKVCGRGVNPKFDVGYVSHEKKDVVLPLYSDLGSSSILVPANDPSSSIRMTLFPPARAQSYRDPVVSSDDRIVATSLRGTAALKGTLTPANWEFEVNYDCKAPGTAVVHLTIPIPPFNDVKKVWRKECDAREALGDAGHGPEVPTKTDDKVGENDSTKPGSKGEKTDNTEKPDQDTNDKAKSDKTDKTDKNTENDPAKKPSKPDKGSKGDKDTVDQKGTKPPKDSSTPTKTGTTPERVLKALEVGTTYEGKEVFSDGRPMEAFSISFDSRLKSADHHYRIDLNTTETEFFLHNPRESSTAHRIDRVSVTVADRTITLVKVTQPYIARRYLSEAGGLIGPGESFRVQLHFICKMAGESSVLITLATLYGDNVEFGFVKECRSPLKITDGGMLTTASSLYVTTMFFLVLITCLGAAFYYRRKRAASARRRTTRAEAKQLIT
ncbi:hypothetical protein NDN08_006331 [Rhodosorus marinus]|uniref:Uncharacterized protein n=1 Tax=Rhodosorus marinus TaxID=101924 RepID=A0AAV8UKD2_9RHOD|nr:hypothetical protein NDN08_006331 [Rhodosorus marinus]